MKMPLRIAAWIMVMAASLTTTTFAQSGQLIETNHFDLTANGRNYRIFTAKPVGDAPEGGFPVIYMTDGNKMLPLAAQNMQSDDELKAVLVGIGYPTTDEQEIIKLRYYDLTPETPADRIPVHFEVPETGGRDKFFSFITDQVRPEIESRFKVNLKQQSLFGHSLGGLFTLYVLFNHNDAFQAFASADPSIWWNGQSILEDKDRFVTANKNNRKIIPLLIETSGKRGGPRPNNNAAATERAAKLRQGPTGADIYQELAKLPSVKGAFHRFDDETHGSMIPLTVKDSLNFLLLGTINPSK